MKNVFVFFCIIILAGCSKKSSSGGSDGSSSTSDPAPSKVSAEATVGDFKAELLEAHTEQIFGRSFGKSIVTGQVTILKLALSNHSKTKIIRFAGWQKSGKLEDEHGNVYKLFNFPTGWKFEDFSFLNVVFDHPLQPSEVFTTYLFFEPFAGSASEARLTVPASAVGGSGDLKLKVRIGQKTATYPSTTKDTTSTTKDTTKSPKE